MVTNTSGSVVFDLDLIIKPSAHGPLQPAPLEEDWSAAAAARHEVVLDREAVVPPGSWFLPLEPVDEDDPRAADSGGYRWKLPVPVETSGVPTVKLEDAASPQSADFSARVVRPYSLRPHLPRQGSIHCLLMEMRYTLNGKVWRRGVDGRVRDAAPLTAEQHELLENAKVAKREQVTGPQNKRDMYELVRQTMERLSGRADAYSEVYTLFPATEGYLNGVKHVSRNRATGFYLHLTDSPNGPVIRIAGNQKGVYPDVIEYFTGFGAGKTDGVKVPLGKDDSASERLMRVKDEACGGDVPTAERWLDRRGNLNPQWQSLLQRLVDESPR